MWLNDFNALRKKEFLGEDMTDNEKKDMEALKKKLEETGGVPEVSKTLIELKEKREKGKGKEEGEGKD